jgi:hypothetical protein
MSNLTKFAADVTAAFILIGGEQSKATYDWMIAAQERQRISNLAQEWIAELRGHDGECNCKHEASVLQTFIDHPDFKGENK